MADLSSGDAGERTVVSDDFFEHEEHLSREQTATLLRDIADQVEDGTELTVSGAEWTIPFEFRTPIEVEVEFVPGREAELEVEFEFTAGHHDGTLSVE